MKLSTAAILLGCYLGLSCGCQKDTGPTAPTPGTIQEVEPNNVAPQVLGTLGTSDITVNGTMADGNDLDKYSIALPGATNLLAKVSWEGTADLDLTVTNAAGIPLTFRDKGTNPESCVLPAQPAGTYTIQVTSKTAAGTAYVLTLGPR